MPSLTHLPVLLYHHVGPIREGIAPSLTVSPQSFAWQLDWLRDHHYVALSIAEAVQLVESGAPPPHRAVLITFDDGYEDLARYAFPTIRNGGMHATVFVVTGLIGQTNVWDEDLSGGNEPLLRASQLCYWAQAGIEFGAHTRSHADLTRLSALDLEGEMLGSKHDLEELLSRPVEAFAYPWGLVDDQVHALATRCFSLAFVDREGRNGGAVDSHLLRRTMVQPRDTSLDFASRALLGWSPTLRLRHRLGAARRSFVSRLRGSE